MLKLTEEPFALFRYVGVIGGMIGGEFGADIGFELAFAFAAVTYPVFRYFERRAHGR